MRPDQIITDEQIELVHGSARFGEMPKREVVNLALLKAACGYSSGSTANRIVAEHGLVKDRGRRGSTALTVKGRKYLWAVYGNKKF